MSHTASPNIDLRSDTVTLPSAAMYEAARAASLGDDVYGEDPTVAALETSGATLLGLEAGLFLPTGTMANLCALLTHGERGRRVVCGRESHVYRYEGGGASALGGLVYHAVANSPDGGLDMPELAEALAPTDDVHVAAVGVLALENTQNRMGGLALTASRTAELVALAHARGVAVHIDGARLFNAAAALGCPATTLVGGADSVQICLSKGLGAPLGSLLLGTAPFVARARRVRKVLGGGMRQSGVVAAMGLVALRENASRLAVDHARALRLAERLAELAGGRLTLRPVRSNMVFMEPRTCSAPELVLRAAEHGVRVGVMGSAVRAVTHLDVDDDQIEVAAEILANAAGRRAHD